MTEAEIEKSFCSSRACDDVVEFDFDGGPSFLFRFGSVNRPYFLVHGQTPDIETNEAIKS
jgi:hypothetical protein